MEIAKTEIEVAEVVVRHAHEAACVELACLELSLVGGGCGVEIFG